jgi:GTP-binding protein HflX
MAVINDWNIGETDRRGVSKSGEKAVLVGVVTPESSEEQVEEYLDELEFLALTAGAYAQKRFVQKLSHPHTKYFVGSGKLDEIAEYISKNEMDLVIFDEDLSPSQMNNIEKKVKVKVVDRSSLILDIFAGRAKTAQARTQVELAQMQYLLPRLRGLWTHLERQKGGIGMRGPGEKEIETDRRIVRDKIKKLEQKLAKIDKQNQTRRKNRGELIRVALVGYTNVGKSTLMNRLSKSEVFAENKLFATLDTTVRKVVFGRMPFLMSDTVGFIRKLPTHLVESFKSTLDEVRESDVLVHVVDISHSHYQDHIATVRNTLKDLGVLDQPTLYVFNKIDKFREKNFDDLLAGEEREQLETGLRQQLIHQYDSPCVFISALTKENMDRMRAILGAMIEEQYKIRYPYKTNFF